MPSTYVDNAMNRRLGRVGMARGSMPVSRSGIPLQQKIYADNAYNRSLGRDGLPHGAMVITKEDKYPHREPRTIPKMYEDFPRTFTSPQREPKSVDEYNDSAITTQFDDTLSSFNLERTPNRNTCHFTTTSNVNMDWFCTPTSTSERNANPFGFSKTSDDKNTSQFDRNEAKMDLGFDEFLNWTKCRIKKEEEKLHLKHDKQWKCSTFLDESLLNELDQLQREDIDLLTQIKSQVEREIAEMRKSGNDVDMSAMKQHLNTELEKLQVKQDKKWSNWIEKVTRDEEEAKEKSFLVQEYKEWTKRKIRMEDDRFREKHEWQWKDITFNDENFMAELAEIQTKETDKWTKWKCQVEREAGEISSDTQVEDLTMRKDRFIKELEHFKEQEDENWRIFKRKVEEAEQQTKEKMFGKGMQCTGTRVKTCIRKRKGLKQPKSTDSFSHRSADEKVIAKVNPQEEVGLEPCNVGSDDVLFNDSGINMSYRSFSSSPLVKQEAHKSVNQERELPSYVPESQQEPYVPRQTQNPIRTSLYPKLYSIQSKVNDSERFYLKDTNRSDGLRSRNSSEINSQKMRRLDEISMFQRSQHERKQFRNYTIASDNGRTELRMQTRGNITSEQARKPQQTRSSERPFTNISNKEIDKRQSIYQYHAHPMERKKVPSSPENLDFHQRRFYVFCVCILLIFLFMNEFVIYIMSSTNILIIFGLIISIYILKNRYM